MKLNKLLLLLLMFFISFNIFSQNKKNEIVNNLFDLISTEALTWIITTDRWPGNKPNISDVSTLDGFEEKLNEDDGIKYNPSTLKSVNLYIKTFKKYRDNLLLKNNLTEEDFKSILEDTIFRNRILQLNKDEYKINSQKYEKYVEEKAQEAFTEYENIPRDNPVPPLDNMEKIEDGDNNAGFLHSLFNAKNLPWLLLIFSVILNILQFLFGRKKKRKSHSSRSQVVEKPSTIEKVENVGIGGNVDKFKPQYLSTGKVQQTINFNYDHLKDELIKRYQAEAFEKEKIKFESLKDETIELTSNKTFSTEKDLLNFLNDKLNSHKLILEEELKNYVSRENAIEEINSNIKSEDFYNESNANYISVDEIDLKIEQIKKDFIESLPTTITRRDLNEEVLYMKKTLDTYINKIVKASLELYMPFADTKGYIADNKKSNVPNRSSAIKLNINPTENTEATFQLLYDKSDMMQPAIVSYDTILLPICNLKNEDFNRDGRRIEQIGNDGRMRLEDGFWKVTEKLNIKIV